MSAPLITFRQLSVSFAAEKQRVRAVQEVSFAIHAGQTVGIVGESGCGKSVTAMALMGLLPPRPRVLIAEKSSLTGRTCCV